MRLLIKTLILSLVASSSSEAQLIINEFMASNATTLYDNTYYNFSDWIELYNSGTGTINLSDYYLSDDENDLKKWKLEGGNLAPGGYYLVYCDEEEGEKHANFGLSTGGETICLSDISGNIVDRISFGEQFTDVSYGRDPADPSGWYYCITPTPLESNIATTATEQAKKVKFSVPAGRINGSTNVSLEGEYMKYTLDGDEPESGSPDYSGSINISQTGTIKARSYTPGLLPGKTAANTYFINEHEFTLPVVSLSFNDEYFYDNTIGIYVKGTNGGPGYCGDIANWNQNWERAAFFEYFDISGVKQISQLIGVKVGGGCTRGRDQKTLSLYARSKYGDNDFDYSFFTQKPYINSFKSLLLRNSGNDQDLTLLRDAFIQALFNNSVDIDYQSYQPTTVYFNGEYRGIMNIREKVDEDYFLSNYNIPSDRIDFLERDREIIRGSDSAYNALLDFLSASDLRDDESFAFVESQIDIEELINYFAVEIYIGNRDWPQNNYKFWRHEDNGKWRWVIFDLDYGFGFRMDIPNHPTFENMYSDNSGRPWSTYLFQQLMQNVTFKARLLSRIITMMHTTFNPQWCDHVMDSLAAIIDTEITYNQEKFGRTKADWYEQIEVIRQQVRGRYDFMQDYIRAYFQLSDPVIISFSNANLHQGRVRMNGVIVPDYPVSIETYASFPLTIEAVPEKGYRFRQWDTAGMGEIYSTDRLLTYGSSMNLALEPVFEEIEPVEGITLNEIASKSEAFLDEYGENSGFIELYNSNNADIALWGYYLSDDADNLLRYSIPDSTLIPAYGFLVFYVDGETMQGPLHTYFRLDSGGEKVYLSQKSGNTIRTLDSISVSSLPGKVSYGRYADGAGEWQYMYQTPSKPNTPEIPVITDVEELPGQMQEVEFSLYPNPSGGTVNISIVDAAVQEQQYFIEVTDLAGRILIPKLWMNSAYGRITVPARYSGIYLVHLYHEGVRIQTKKLLIIR